MSELFIIVDIFGCRSLHYDMKRLGNFDFISSCLLVMLQLLHNEKDVTEPVTK